jgi:hypothetical protein
MYSLSKSAYPQTTFRHIKGLLAHFILVIPLLSACGGGGSDGNTTTGPDSTNTPPSVNAGSDQNVTEGASIQLSGSGNDAEGAVTYLWAQTSGTTVTLSDTASATPSFTAPSVNANESLTFSLTVTDTGGLTASDSVTINVADSSGANTPPSADAGIDQSVSEGDSVQLAGSGSDGESTVTYLWSQTSGTTVALSDSTSATPSFTAPSVSADETLTFLLTVTDDGALTDTDTVNITVRDSSGSSTADNYLFYFSDNGELSAVDPTDPTSPILVNANTIHVDLIETSDYDGTAKTTSNRRHHVLIYADTDGHLYKVYADRNTPLSATQISNESQADTICVDELTDDPTAPDFLTPEASQFVYTLAGPDANCGTDDDVWKMVRLNMDTSTPPIDAYRPVVPVLDSATGGLSGWLVSHMGALGRCDADFANCSAITGYTLGIDLLEESLDYFMLEVDNTLRSYDIANGTLSTSLFDIPQTSVITNSIHDGTTLFFSQGNSLYTAPLDGSSPASLLASESDTITSVELSGSYVVIDTGSGTASDEIRAVPIAGGASNLLASTSGDNSLVVVGLSENYVYYNEYQVASSLPDPYLIIPVAAGIVATDGSTHARYDDAAWSGETMKTTWDLTAGYSRSHIVDKMILAEGYALATGAGGYSGATVTTFNAATGLADNVLGTLPTTEGITAMFCIGHYTKDALCEVNTVITPLPTPPAQNYQGEIFYIDATAANSLMRSTTTPNVHDIPASYL